MRAPLNGRFDAGIERLLFTRNRNIWWRDVVALTQTAGAGSEDRFRHDRTGKSYGPHMNSSRVMQLRAAMVLSLVSFLALNFLFLSHRNLAADYVGIPWHFGLLIMIAMVEAPSWARAMGFAWIALEFIMSGASIHGFPSELTAEIRFGGAHLCTALWIAGALYRKPVLLQIIGVGLVLIHLATCLLPIPVSMPLFFAMFALTFLWVALLGWAGERVLAPISE